MLRSWSGLIAVSCFVSVLPAAAFDPGEWKLVFEDGFERADVGPDWTISSGKAEIIDGKMNFMPEGEKVALIDRHFAPDVRVEFDAVPAPEKPACDLSVGLACGKAAAAYGTGYFLGFGGNFNTLNQIQGGRDMEWVSEWYPKTTIQPGKVHRICGMKEGKTITLAVDGKVIVTALDKDPLGGPGFDMAGLVTWNGMIVDNVKVYERKTRHPDTPRYVVTLKGLPLTLSDDRKLSAVKPADDAAVNKAIELFNSGEPREAEKVFLTVSDPEMRAAGAAYCIGHLYHEAKTQEFERVGRMLIDLARAHPGDERLLDYAELGRRIQGLTVLRIVGQPNGELAAGAILAMGRANNPVYDKAYFYKARLMRAHSMEGANQGMDKVLAMFKELRQWYPKNQSVREILGEHIPWGQEVVDDTSDAPAWARYLRELYSRQCAVLNWWFTQRQWKTGELGGGWGDDCEILREWGPLAVISTGDPNIVAGIERLCAGIWTGAINPEFGFSGYSDCEHSSEPSTDTQPTMMILQWGDPLWIEHNMRSAKTIRDIYMGVDKTGHYRFKSSYYGEGIVGQNPQQEGDVHYNTRTMKHLQHLAFWGNKEARRVYLSWMDGWREQTMKPCPQANKAAGVVPGQLFYPTGTPIPPHGKIKDWVTPNGADPDAVPGMGGMIQQGFVSSYLLTRDARFLEPMYNYLTFGSYGPLLSPQGLKPRSLEWTLCGQQGDTHTNTVACFRWLTNDKTVDEYLLRFARPYQRYLVSNDLDLLIKQVEAAAKSLRTNFRLMTEELLQTDRAGLPAMAESVGAYTGALHNWSDGLLPTMAVTWEAPDTNFAALVVESLETHVRVWVYNFNEKPTRLGMRLWRLKPGVYAAYHGEIMKGESTNKRYHWGDREEFTYRRRLDTYYVDVPPHKPYAIDVRLVQPMEVPATGPDAGIADRDLAIASPGTLTAVVHSLGNEPLNRVSAVLESQAADGRWTRLAERHTGRLAAPEFDPVTQKLTFTKVPNARAYRILLDPDNKIDELYEGNNAASLTVK